MIIRLTTRTVNHLQSIHRSSNFLSSYCGWCINRIDHHQVQPLFVRNYIGQFHHPHHYHRRLSQKYNGGHRLLSTKSSEIPSPSPSPNDDDNHQKSSKLNKIYTIPNIICMARIAITPFIGYLIVRENFDLALTICAISSLSDFLDGWIARNFDSISKLGSILDPLADKFLIASLTLTLTYVNMIPIWLTLLIFLRDFLIILGGFWLRYRSLQPPITFERFFNLSTFTSERFSPTFISKLNTGFQLTLVSFTLASPVFSDLFRYLDFLLPSLQWITGVTTLWSGILYIKRLF
ncbi:cardiolipin synthase [Dermatophagoides pteronyssinus]|uniref:cardiolipin synthase (CMP-forming) n=1 Tax=Dermatophagoides pteronyssinus TaxID=6956 RepID=A0ABQ8JLQ2_DERPT|nr:cardiolipin synthase [Dermatophagoides pteronyssinus]